MGYLKKGMQCNTAGIYGSYSGWRHHGQLSKSVFPDVFQKSGFAGARFSGQEDVAVCLIHKPNSQLKQMIGCIGRKSHSISLCGKISNEKY